MLCQTRSLMEVVLIVRVLNGLHKSKMLLLKQDSYSALAIALVTLTQPSSQIRLY